MLVVYIAEQASARKEEKYAALALSHTFILIATEITGPISSKASSFLQELGSHPSVTTANSRESSLHSYFSNCLLLCNDTIAVCIRGTFGAVQDNDSD